MKINPNKCVACGNCTYVCPMGAIYIDPAIKRATVDRNECVECYACFNGMSQEHLNPTMVRTIRKVFQLLPRCASIPSRTSAPPPPSSPRSWPGRAWCGAHSPIRACRTNPPAWRGAAPKR